MPKNNTTSYVKWSDRKRQEKLRPAIEVPAKSKPNTPPKPTTAPRLKRVPIVSVCRECGAKFSRMKAGVFCTRSCQSTANAKTNLAWERAVAAKLEREEGWQMFTPSSCCDRIGIKDGQVFFVEFKPKGRTELRHYQRLVRNITPQMYRIVVAPYQDPEQAEMLSDPKVIVPPKSSGSRFKGVNWDSMRGLWRARLMVNGSRESIGYFPTEEDAARAYDKSLRQQRGPRARVNFPASCGR